MEYLTALPEMSEEEKQLMEDFRIVLANMPKTKQSPYLKPIQVKVKRNSSLSQLRHQGHKYFDMIWRNLKLIGRNELYKVLSDYLNVSEEQAHFSRMNNETCVKAIEICIQFLNDDRRLDLDITGKETRAYYQLQIS